MTRFERALILTLTLASALGAALWGTAGFAGTRLHLQAGNIDSQSMALTQSTSGAGKSSAASDLIVQFTAAITEADKAALRGAGAEIFGYLPDDALMVRMNEERALKFKASRKGVFAILAFRPEFRMSPAFLHSAGTFNPDAAQTVLIKTFKTTETAGIAHQISELPKAVIHAATGTSIVVTIPRRQVKAVASLQGIEHVQPYLQMKPLHFEAEPDPVMTPRASGDYSDLNGFETGTKVLNFDGAWAAGFTGRNQITAMADTGLDRGEGNLSPDFSDAVLHGYIFGLFSKSWEDPMGHGTHVAGSVLGRGTKSGGKLKGGAYEAKFVPESLWSPMMKGLTVPSKVQDLFQQAYADGARVHTNSWGANGNFGAYDNYASNVDEFMFNHPDMLILYAAGNSGVDSDKDGRIDPGSIGSPGTAKNALTVGASENLLLQGGIQRPVSQLRDAALHWGAEPIFSSHISDNVNGLAMFSSRGPTLDGRLKPDIVAPGTNILSARSHVPGAEVLWGIYNEDYVYSGGTSMATPLAAGGATVARQVLQEKFHFTSPSAALLKATLLHTAVDMYPGQYGEVGAAHGQEILTRRPNADEGYGRLDVAAVSGLTEATHFVDNTVGIGAGETQEITVTLAKPGQILVNLVYTDAPASPNAATALVNDLDLSVTAPGGSVTASHDRLNNSEVVELSAAAAGSYKISVQGVKIPQGKNGKQPYALVYTAREGM